MADDFSFDSSLNGALAVIDNSTRMAEMNKGITPMFFTEDVEDQAATAQAGTLRMTSVERVRLFTAGDMNSCPVHPVSPALIERFSEAYARWKATRSNDHIEGTPLSAWAMVSRGFVMELAALHIRSVEDLAGIADTNITKINDGRQWRAKAAAWLAVNKDASAAARYAAKSEHQDGEIAELKRQIADLAARLDKQGKRAA
jgi:hypothetical protein